MKNQVKLHIVNDSVMCEFLGEQENRMKSMYGTNKLRFGISSACSILKEEIVAKVQECNPNSEILWA